MAGMCSSTLYYFEPSLTGRVKREYGNVCKVSIVSPVVKVM